MLVTKSETLTRDEIIALIRKRSERANVSFGKLMRDFASGNLPDFGRLSDIYALCELLDSDDPAFSAAA